MTNEPTKYELHQKDKDFFLFLAEAMSNGNVCLVACTDATTGEYAPVVCFLEEEPDGTRSVYPLFKVPQDNDVLFDSVIPPDSVKDTGRVLH